MRKLAYFYLIPAIMILLCGCVSDNDDEQEQQIKDDSTIKLSTLVKKMRQVTDPQGECLRCKTYILKQKMLTEDGKPDEKYEITSMFQKEPYFTKQIIYKNGKPESISLYDGKNAWSIDPESGKNKPLTGIRLDVVRALSKIGNPAYSYSDIFPKIDVKEVIAGTIPYYKLICHPKTKNLEYFTIYVDKNNYVTRKVTFRFKNAQYMINYSSYTDKYKRFDGVLMPLITTVEANGKKYQYEILEFKLNAEFPPNTFELPIPWYDKKAEAELKLKKQKMAEQKAKAEAKVDADPKPQQNDTKK